MDMNWLYKDRHRTKDGEGTGNFCALSEYASPLPTESSPFGFLRRLYYIVVID